MHGPLYHSVRLFGIHDVQNGTYRNIYETLLPGESTVKYDSENKSLVIIVLITILTGALTISL